MKGKQINLIERHGEKLFFVLILAALLAVLFKQFATGGMTVKVGAKDELSIGQGYDVIASQAERLEGQIKSNELDNRAPMKAPDVISVLEGAIPGKSVGSTAMIIGIPDSGALGGDPSGTGTPNIDGAMYAMPTPVEPARPLLKRYGGTIDPATVATTPGLDAIVGPEQPYDLHAVTVSTGFDAAALRASFQNDPDGPGPLQAIPGHWWRGQLVLLDVELWREEVYPGGESGPETLVGPLPGYASVRAQIDDPEVTMPEIFRAVEEVSQDIARPDYYPVISGALWSPPAPPIQYSAPQIEANRRRAEIARIDEEIRSLQQTLDDADPGRQRSHRNTPSVDIGSYTVGGIGGGRGRGREGGNRDNSAAAAAQRQERREKAINTKIDGFRSERDEHVAWLTEQGLPIEVEPVEDPGIALLRQDPGSLKDSDTLDIWATDCGVEPGATYRYRIRLVYGNPFFGRDNVIREQQRKELAGPRVLRSAYSPWSDTVTMDQTSYYFLTRVSGPGGVLNRDTSRIVYAEVYTFFYGFWRKAEVRLRPGDPIVGDFQLPAMETYEFPPLAEGQKLNPREIARKPIESTLLRSLATIMLDARPSARVNRNTLKGGRDDEPIFEAVLLDANGQIEVRDPSQDRTSERRQLMKLSAEQGVTAVVVEPGLGGVAGVATKKSKDPADRDERSRDREGPRGGRGGIGG
jgi:hypothetical protein